MTTLADDGRVFFERINNYLNVDDRLCVQEAFSLARRAHGDQRRKSGELFFTHPLTVAYYLAEYQLDAPALVAALLHDVAEDTVVTLHEIRNGFGEEVARLVEGVTKLKDVSGGGQEPDKKPSDKAELEAATLHHMLDVMTEDVRTVIIKIFDRLHNMRTIKATSYDRQVYKANETLSIYAPLANRLGMWKIKNELQYLSLDVLHPTAFNKLQTLRTEMEVQQVAEFRTLRAQVYDVLFQSDITPRRVYYAPENASTIYQDLLKRNGASEIEVDNTMRLVILLDDLPTCYLAMGYLHQIWQPVPDMIDDYIAVPRDNLYRSLHTTVVHSNGRHLKLRFRTSEMDMVDDIGIMARWLYRGTSLWNKEVADRVETFLLNINESINLEQKMTDKVRGVVENVFVEQIRVYTPRGEEKELPRGATPIDFAYAIHTGLGDQCYAAQINGVLQPLNTPLKNGVQVKIVKKMRQQPLRSWLDEDLGYIFTNYARHHAERWFRRLSEKEALAQGEALLKKELKMIGVPNYNHVRVAHFFGLETTQQLYHDLGRAEILPTTIALRVLEENWAKGPSRSLDNVVYSEDGIRYVITYAGGRDLRLCGTCQPRPPESIYGYLRKDGGVTVHKRDCHTLRSERFEEFHLALSWGEAPRNARLVDFTIQVFDRPGLLFDISNLLQSEFINIAYINTPKSAAQNELIIDFTIEVETPRQLVRIAHQIQALSNVAAVIALPKTGKNDLLPASSLYRPE